MVLDSGYQGAKKYHQHTDLPHKNWLLRPTGPKKAT